MVTIAAELEDVPLRNSHVLQELPRRIGQALRRPSANARRNAFEGRLHAHVSPSAAKQVQHLFSNRSVDRRIVLRSTGHFAPPHAALPATRYGCFSVYNG